MAMLMWHGIHIVGLLHVAQGQAQPTSCDNLLQVETAALAKVSANFSEKEAEISEEEAMMHILDQVYSLGETVPGGWSLAHGASLAGRDQVAIYKKGDICAIAFSGSNDGNDWLQNFNGLGTHPTCHDAFRVHNGILQETMQVLNHEDFTSTLAPYLADRNECLQVYSVGHSLGGAVASLFATLVNNPLCSKVCENQACSGVLESFRVAKLYTAGAPAFTKDRLTDENGECFDGKRFFNEDAHSVDPVARLPTLISYRHPKVEAVRLRRYRQGWRRVFHYVKNTFACDEDRAGTEPDSIGARPSVTLHERAHYLLRAQKVYR